MPRASALNTDRIRHLHSQGMSDGEIGQAMDVHRRTIASARRRMSLPAHSASESGKKGGKAAQQGMAEHLAAQQEIARQMHAEGRKNTEIAKRLDVSGSRVTKILKSIGLVGAHQPGRGISVSQKPTNAKPRNEFYRLARMARARAWERVMGGAA